MKIYTPWFNRPVYKGVKILGPSMTETSGYRSSRDQIFDLLNAGIKLDAQRRASYDIPDDNVNYDDYEPDPTRNPDFDLVDGDALYNRLMAKKVSALQKMKEAKNKPPEEAPKGENKEVTE